MTPALAAFIAGLGFGIPLGAWLVVADRRASIRARLQAPPFTTVEAGR